jgi:hypothetical protein
MEYYKEMHTHGESVMCVSKVFESGECIVVYPNHSIHHYSNNHITNTQAKCTAQEFEIIRLQTIEFLKQ